MECYKIDKSRFTYKELTGKILLKIEEERIARTRGEDFVPWNNHKINGNDNFYLNLNIVKTKNQRERDSRLKQSETCSIPTELSRPKPLARNKILCQ